MTSFLYTARTASGGTLTDRIEAESLDAALLALEHEGLREILFHTDEFAEATLAMAKKEVSPHLLTRPITPQQERKSRQLGGTWGLIWFGWKREWHYWFPLLLWNSYSFYHGRPFGDFAWLGFALSGLFLVAFIFMRLPGIAYNQLIEATVWHRGQAVKRWVELLRSFKRFFNVGVPEMELDCRIATVMARDGDLDRALAIFQKHEVNSVGRAYYFCRQAEIYGAAKEYQKMVECRLKAMEESRGGQNETVDYALGLVRRLHDATAAQQVLARVSEQRLTDIGHAYLHYCRGLIALEQKHASLAESEFRAALLKNAAYEMNPLASGMLKEVKAFLSIALAQQGNFEEARKLFADASPLLNARRETELLARCESALGMR
ncbi:MAG: hypothetical protein HY298_04685 [Verrucomicrobia bacterium]|nr:hypothetical protein [Verrucomicrobiota bacterium]